MIKPTIWESLHFPVLQAAVEAINADRDFAGVRIQALAATTGFDVLDVLAAVRQLETADLVELRLMSPAAAGRVVRVSGQALQLVGEWPTATTAADRLFDTLAYLVENGSEAEQTSASQVLDGIGGRGSAFVEKLAAGMLGGEIE